MTLRKAFDDYGPVLLLVGSMVAVLIFEGVDRWLDHVETMARIERGQSPAPPDTVGIKMHIESKP